MTEEEDPEKKKIEEEEVSKRRKQQIEEEEMVMEGKKMIDWDSQEESQRKLMITNMRCLKEDYFHVSSFF